MLRVIERAVDGGEVGANGMIEGNAAAGENKTSNGLVDGALSANGAPGHFMVGGPAE